MVSRYVVDRLSPSADLLLFISRGLLDLQAWPDDRMAVSNGMVFHLVHGPTIEREHLISCSEASNIRRPDIFLLEEFA